MTLTDDRLAAAFEEMAGHPDAGSLVTDVLRAIDATPQHRRGLGLLWPSGRLSGPAVIGLLLLAAALAGTIAVGSGLVRLPWSVIVPPTTTHDANGEIALRADGCTILAKTLDGDLSRVLTEGFPNCYPTSNSFDLAWSPDGRRLAMAYAFFCGGCGTPQAQTAIDLRITGLWVMDVETDTYDQVLACDLGCLFLSPRWAPDGSRIAYGIVEGPAGLWVVPAAGGPAQRIDSGSGGIPADFAWSPDSTRLAVVRNGSGPSLVSIASLDGSNETFLMNSLDNVASIDWSPDGHTIVIASGETVELIELIDEGSGLRATNGSPRVLYTQPDGHPITHVRWSPDGSRIAWVEAGAPLESETEPTVIPNVRYGAMDADGADRTVLFRTQGPVIDFSRPVWSPDGAYLTFSIDDWLGQTQSFVTAADGDASRLIDVRPRGGASQLTAPAWRPVPAP
jgi:Tol biopolymer transport system component